jgi:PTS system mannose-specific IID component
VTARTFLRAFTIQGSWNYRTMLGNGFAFAMLPVLRRVHEDARDLEEAVARHTEHFNAHPYLANLALGAVARMEAEGREEELIERFKIAVKGPLGGLGDTLMWVTFLPTALLVALVLAWVGSPPWLAVGMFLILYNIGHLALRVWAFRTGLRDGQGVAANLRRVGLGARAEELARAGSLLLGVLLGLVLTHDPGLGSPRWLWGAAALLAVGVGLLGGKKVWRPTALVVVASVTTLCLIPLIL